MNTIIVSFYSDLEPEKQYAEHAVKFINNVKSANLKYDVQELQPLSTWQEIVRFKPQFILDMLDKHNSPIMWIDIDNVIIDFEAIKVLDTLECDIAAPKETETSFRTSVNAIFVNNTPEARRFVEEWNNKCKVGKYEDHIPFTETWDELEAVSKLELPVTFTHRVSKKDTVILVGYFPTKGKVDFYNNDYKK